MPKLAIDQYRAKVLAHHKRAFDLHRLVATPFEEASKVARTRPTLAHLVIDMLMMQSMKTHAAVSLLCQHGLMEDSATEARRLMELSVQGVWIGAEDKPEERERKAGRYIAFMWRQIRPRFKRRLPKSIRTQWSSTARSYGRFVPKKAKSWGPNFRTMFTDIGQEALYVSDYAFLSTIAHGSSEYQIVQFSQRPIPIHNDQFVTVLLVYSSRYYLAVADQWNQLFSGVPEEQYNEMRKKVLAWKRTTPAKTPQQSAIS